MSEGLEEEEEEGTDSGGAGFEEEFGLIDPFLGGLEVWHRGAPLPGSCEASGSTESRL